MGEAPTNLRSSRETELARNFPWHCVTAWLGNTPTVATKHDLQVTADDYAKAIAQGGAHGGAVGGSKDGKRRKVDAPKMRKPRAKLCFPRFLLFPRYARQDSNLQPSVPKVGAFRKNVRPNFCDKSFPVRVLRRERHRLSAGCDFHILHVLPPNSTDSVSDSVSRSNPLQPRRITTSLSQPHTKRASFGFRATRRSEGDVGAKSLGSASWRRTVERIPIRQSSGLKWLLWHVASLSATDRRRRSFALHAGTDG